MSFNICATCRHTGLCTFPRSGVITECDEFEDTDRVQSHDWNLQDLLKLWNESEEHSKTE